MLKGEGAEEGGRLLEVIKNFESLKDGCEGVPRSPRGVNEKRKEEGEEGEGGSER